MTNEERRPGNTVATSDTDTTQPSSIDFPVLLLDILGHTDTEYTSLGYENGNGFHTAVMTPSDAVAAIGRLPRSADVYFGVNPTKGPARKNSGRGVEADTTRLAAVWCDLDVKPGACPTLDVARAVVANLSSVLGTRPSVTVDSGHGLHAYWPVDGGHITDTADSAAILKRWGRLVAVVAGALDVAVDSVFDLPRMMRVPGSLNNKNANPLPVIAHEDTGAPLTVAEIGERLDEHGVSEEPGDRDTAEQVSDPQDWDFADASCNYVTEIIDKLPNDGPLPGKGRHQWVLKQAVRLACAVRLGCLGENDWHRAKKLLDERLRQLRAATGQKVPRYEVPAAVRFGIETASTKTDEQCRHDLGEHEHGGQAPDDASVDHDAEWLRERDIGIELDKLRVRSEAKRRLDAEQRPVIEYPPVKSLESLLAEPDIPTRYRIESVAPEAARVLLSAQYKAGKTTITGNLLRALVDREAFLGTFRVNSTARPVLIDNEMSENTLRRWLRDQNIVNTSAVADVIALRGKVSAFNLLDEQCRATWAARLRDVGCNYLILDCLRPVLDSLGLDENHDAGTFLVAFDALLTEAGIADALIVQHMGHANERARGDSRLQDWPDAIWRLVRENEEPDSGRFFSAYGRDVDVHEGRLSFDPVTRRLTYVAGSRRDAKTEAAIGDVTAVLAEHALQGGDGLSVRRVELATGGNHPRDTIRDALRELVRRDLVVAVDGPRRSKLHRITRPCVECGYPLAAGQRDRHIECGDATTGADS